MGVVFSVLFYQLYEKAASPAKPANNGSQQGNSDKVELRQGTQMSRLANNNTCK